MKKPYGKDSFRATFLRAYLPGLLFGSLLGAVAMLLLAPRAGQKTRSQMQRQSARLRRGAVESMEDVMTVAGDKAHQFTESVQQGAGEWQHNAQELLGVGKK